MHVCSEAMAKFPTDVDSHRNTQIPSVIGSGVETGLSQVVNSDTSAHSFCTGHSQPVPSDNATILTVGCRVKI